MVDMASIAAAVTGLKTATDIAKTLVDIKTTAEVQAKAIELQGVILSAQASALAANSEQFTLLQRVRELEEEVARMKAWDAEKQRYRLEEVWHGAFAYVLNPSMDPAEPIHWLCASCYQKGRKSFLQDHGPTPHDARRRSYVCPDCKATIGVHYSVRPGKAFVPAKD